MPGPGRPVAARLSASRNPRTRAKRCCWPGVSDDTRANVWPVTTTFPLVISVNE